jgi:hypothetical protein
MKKKKLKLKPKKQTINKWKRDNRALALISSLLVIFGLMVGGFVGTMWALSRPYDQHPHSVVIAADKTTTIPADLLETLQNQDKCRHYRGPDTADGVNMWTVYQLSRGKFAKISYGCSTNLDFYIMAVKSDKSWQLLQPAEYFASGGFLPKCIQVEKYQIDKTIEPFCIKDDGQARPNAIN